MGFLIFLVGGQTKIQKGDVPSSQLTLALPDHIQRKLNNIALILPLSVSSISAFILSVSFFASVGACIPLLVSPNVMTSYWTNLHV